MDCHVPPFRLDVEGRVLWRGNRKVALHPRHAAVLSHLVRHAGELVAAGDLLPVAWPDAAADTADVKAAIQAIRRAMDDDARAPRYVETVHPLVYRFIGPVFLPDGERWQPAGPAFVGRQAARAVLHAQLAAADTGTRRMVFVTGDAGIGKTALCDRFLRDIDDRDGWTGRLRCVKGTPSAELLRPLCDDLRRLWRESARGFLPGMHDTLREDVDPAEQAPPEQDWMPGAPPPPGASLRAGRELATLLDAVAADRRIVLVINDLQWADGALLETIGSIAGRAAPGRVLLLATMRPRELAVAAYALANLRVKLKLRSRAVDLPLGPLNEGDVLQMLALRFSNDRVAAALARPLHQACCGNPGRAEAALAALRARGLLEYTPDGWRLCHSDLGLAAVLAGTSPAAAATAPALHRARRAAVAM